MKNTEWVKFYHKIGWNILPAREKKKNPLIPSWRYFQDHKVEDSVIRDWIKQGKFSNINLCLGKISNVYEIDVDCENAPIGIVQGLYDSNEIWICESSNGKLKVFFKTSKPLPAKLDVKVNKDGGHVELRGDNHLSVLPPSIHPNGTQYTWLTDVKNNPLIPVNGEELYNTIVKNLKAEYKYVEERKWSNITLSSSGSGVRDFFMKSMKKGTPWSGQQGHYFRLAFCAELVNNNYDDSQIHAFFKAHDNKSGEDYSYKITQSKIDEIRKKGMHCWSNKKITECCPDILGDIQ